LELGNNRNMRKLDFRFVNIYRIDATSPLRSAPCKKEERDEK